jgi:nitrite reductase/ring-hydroxylating ferredoxin subunit
MIDVARVVCPYDDLSDPGSRAFAMGGGEWPLRGFVVRRNGKVFAYVNRCPHAGHPLNWQPDRFLTPDDTLILCRSHGALFEIATGACVAGPCAGNALTPLSVTIDGGYVLLNDDPDTLADANA